MRRLRSNNAAFTIIELMIATTVFSVILLICATTLIQVSRIYQKGVINNQTQEVARTTMASIAESIQFGGGNIKKIPASTDFCIDNKQYSYVLNKKLTDDGPPPTDETKRALIVDTQGGCIAGKTPSTLTDGSAKGNELLSPNMRVLKLAVCVPADTDPACAIPPAAGSNLYRVELIIAYGDSDLLNADNTCKTARAGGSFCSVSSLTTTVQKRIIK